MAENNVEVKFTAQDVMSAIIGGINKAFAAMTGASQAAGEAVAGMSQNLDEAATSNNLLGDAIKNAWDAIVSHVSAAGKKISETLKGTGQNLNTDGLKQGLSTFSTAAGTAVELVKTKVEIALIAFVTGVSAAVLTVGYAAYKSVSALVGLFTGSFYKSENIDAVIAMNKEIAALQKTFGITAVQAGALNDAMRRLGVDSTGYADVYAKVTDALRGNADALTTMGVKYKDLNGKLLSNQDVLQNAKAMLETYTEGWDRNQAALALGLGSYEQINNYLKINQEELKKSKDRLDEYNLAMGPEAQKYVQEYQQTMLSFNNELKLSGDGMKRVFADQVMPAYTELAKIFNDGWPSIVNGTRHVLAAFTSLGYGLKMSFDVMYDTTTGITKAVLAGLGAIAAGVAFALEGDWKNAAKSLINGFDDALAKVKGIRDTVAEDAEKNLKAMQLAQGKFSQSSVENDKKIAEGRKFKKDVAVAADEDEVSRLQKLAKVETNYAKMLGTLQQQMTAEYNNTYRDRKEALIAYYDQIKASAYSTRESEQYEKLKNARLLELEKQHAQDMQLVRLRSSADAVAARKAAFDQETVAIGMQAAKKEITAFEAERRITALTVANLQDQYNSRKATADKALEIYGQDSAEYRARLKEMESAHSAYTSANLAAYKTYSDNIKKIDQEIADFRLSIQQKIADLQQRGMTEGQKYADNQKRFDEAYSKSRSALAAKETETAQKYFKQAEELASRLADKKAEQNTKMEDLQKQHQERLSAIANKNTGTQTDQQRQASEMAKENADFEKQRLALMAEQKATTEGITNATNALNKVEQLGVDILAAKKRENSDALVKLKEIQDFKLDPKNLPVTLDEGALGQVRSQIAALTRSETKTIYIKTVEGKSSGGMVGMSRGGKLPGESLFDSIPVLARPGEWFIRNESARVWGDGFMQAINTPFSTAGQKLQAILSRSQQFSTGGQVQAVDMGSLTINVGSAAFPVQGQTSVLEQLKHELRREQMRRPTVKHQ